MLYHALWLGKISESAFELNSFAICMKSVKSLLNASMMPTLSMLTPTNAKRQWNVRHHRERKQGHKLGRLSLSVSFTFMSEENRKLHFYRGKWKA